VTPGLFVATSAILAAFALAGGVYALLFTYGTYSRRRSLVIVGWWAYGAQVFATICALFGTPLSPGWKTFLALSCVAYCFIPPATLRLLVRLHALPEESA